MKYCTFFIVLYFLSWCTTTALIIYLLPIYCEEHQIDI